MVECRFRVLSQYGHGAFIWDDTPRCKAIHVRRGTSRPVSKEQEPNYRQLLASVDLPEAAGPSIAMIEGYGISSGLRVQFAASTLGTSLEPPGNRSLRAHKMM